MAKLKTMKYEVLPDPHQDEYSKTVFGFWVYLLTDFMMFATLFAVYAVLYKSTFGGPGPKDLFDLSSVMKQTWALLISVFFVGLGGASAHRSNRYQTICYFILTFIFGIAFMWLMTCDFSHIIRQGNTWESSAFMSAYFTLIGTFAVHVLFGLLWIIVLVLPVMCHGLSKLSIRRLTCLRMFWQFLNIIWIFIFSIIYLLGVMK